MFAQIFLNLVMAFVWASLQGSYSLPTLVFGFIIGAVILKIVGRKAQIKKLKFPHLWALVKLFFVFMYELIKANVQVLYLVFAPKLELKPAIIALPIDVKGALWISTLANMITLTPGTLTVEVAPDKKTLYIHVLDVDDEEQVKKDIKNTFERLIMEVNGQ